MRPGGLRAPLCVVPFLFLGAVIGTSEADQREMPREDVIADRALDAGDTVRTGPADPMDAA